MLKCSRRSERASLEVRDVKRNILRRCARAAGKLAEVRFSEEAVRAYQSLSLSAEKDHISLTLKRHPQPMHRARIQRLPFSRNLLYAHYPIDMPS
jgi:hypothetical protein